MTLNVLYKSQCCRSRHYFRARITLSVHRTVIIGIEDFFLVFNGCLNAKIKPFIDISYFDRRRAENSRVPWNAQNREIWSVTTAIDGNPDGRASNTTLACGKRPIVSYTQKTSFLSRCFWCAPASKNAASRIEHLCRLLEKRSDCDRRQKYILVTFTVCALRVGKCMTEVRCKIFVLVLCGTTKITYFHDGVDELF